MTGTGPYCAKALMSLHDNKNISCGLDCPDGSRIVLDFSLHWVGQNNGTTLTALHGPEEVQADMIELCARDRYGVGCGACPGVNVRQGQYKYLDFIACMDKNYETAPATADSCAQKTGVDMKVINKCVMDEGRKLLARSFAYSSSKGVMATPSVLIARTHKFLGVPTDLRGELCKYAAGPKDHEVHDVYHSKRPHTSLAVSHP